MHCNKPSITYLQKIAKYPGPSLKGCRLTGKGVSIINLRRSDDRLRFIMGIPLPRKWCHLSEQRPMQHAAGPDFIIPVVSQVSEVWRSYELDLINYQNKCRIIRGWDDLFNKVKEHINSVAAMKLSPYYKVSLLGHISLKVYELVNQNLVKLRHG